MKVHKSVTLERCEELSLFDRYMGLCIACGAEKDGVEPDAHNYECDECGENQVYGAEELILMLL